MFKPFFELAEQKQLKPLLPLLSSSSNGVVNGDH